MITRIKPRPESHAPLRDSLKPLQKRLTRFWPVFACLLLVGGVVWRGSDRLPADLTEPIVWKQSETVTPARAKLRVGSFNIHGGRGPTDTFTDLAATAAQMKTHDLDLVGLYEVRGGFSGDQVTTLGQHLGMASLFVPSETRYWRPHFGNGLLSQVEVENVIPIPLPCTQGRKYRNAILATVRLDGVPVQILATHIDTRLDHDRQREFVAKLFQSLQPPAILMGDLNQNFFDKQFAEAFSRQEITDALRQIPNSPDPKRRRIDHIFVRGLKVTASGVDRNGSSDHPIIWAELALPDATE